VLRFIFFKKRLSINFLTDRRIIASQKFLSRAIKFNVLIFVLPILVLAKY